MLRILSRKMRPGSIAALFCLMQVGRAPAGSVTVPIVGTGATGTYNCTSSSVVFNTTLGTAQFGSVTEYGTVYSGYTVFDFSGNVTIGPGQLVTAVGANPVILLSTGNINVDGTINVSGAAGAAGDIGNVGQGGGGGGAGGAGGSVVLAAQGTVSVESKGQILANGGNGGAEKEGCPRDDRLTRGRAGRHGRSRRRRRGFRSG